MTLLKREATLPVFIFAGLCVALQAIYWIMLGGPILTAPLFTCTVAACILAGAADLSVMIRDTMDRRIREIHSDLIRRATSAEASGLLELLASDEPPTQRRHIRRVP